MRGEGGGVVTLTCRQRRRKSAGSAPPVDKASVQEINKHLVVSGVFILHGGGGSKVKCRLMGLYFLVNFDANPYPEYDLIFNG